jgi:hypothetical protein
VGKKLISLFNIILTIIFFEIQTHPKFKSLSNETLNFFGGVVGLPEIGLPRSLIASLSEGQGPKFEFEKKNEKPIVYILCQLVKT